MAASLVTPGESVLSSSTDNLKGFVLAIASSAFIGSSFIIKKKGLQRAGALGPRASSGGYGYLLEPLWWVGMVTMVVGEIANFIAYIYAPAVLVTPLGALSIIVSAVLAHFLLKEKLRKMGILGCVLCIVGSTLIVLHAPSERSLSSVEEIWELAIQPAFLLYTASAIAVVLVLVLYCEPRYGQTNIMVYIGICSIIGSLTVMSIKAIGIAIKLTLEGSSQVAHFQTWVFLMVAITCIITQLNYLNKALDTFDTAVVSPIYFAMFTSFTILASAIMFKISMHHILLKYLGLSLSMVKYGSGKMMKSCALIFLRSFDMTISNERCLGISILQSTEGSAE
ncbi:probable magnesium transporter NIPA6 isoform X5 [Malania oleifera]|uniref:probable magnesium transporter NIPA6 isoform X5 n=1 Tax=Malania oleifera TaxID=397392 RepID=UPI0025ADA23C|nr:probable magnesium transporter NIPA6 isoform X5 [Malania oleifera]